MSEERLKPRRCSHTCADGLHGSSGRLARALDLHEYQGKELFRQHGIPVSEGRLALDPSEARAAADELGYPVVVKAQVLTDGRGKAGGIKLAATGDEVEARAGEILGMDIRGHVVTKVWIERASDIEREYYLSLTFDRSEKKPLFMFTTQGGMEIEEVAATNPDALVRLHVDPLEGCHPWHARRLVYGGGVTDPSEQKQIAAIVQKLYDVFVTTRPTQNCLLPNGEPREASPVARTGLGHGPASGAVATKIAAAQQTMAAMTGDR